MNLWKIAEFLRPAPSPRKKENIGRKVKPVNMELHSYGAFMFVTARPLLALTSQSLAIKNKKQIRVRPPFPPAPVNWAFALARTRVLPQRGCNCLTVAAVLIEFGSRSLFLVPAKPPAVALFAEGTYRAHTTPGRHAEATHFFSAGPLASLLLLSSCCGA